MQRQLRKCIQQACLLPLDLNFSHIQWFCTDKSNAKLKSILQAIETTTESYYYNLLAQPNTVCLESHCSHHANGNKLSSLFPKSTQLHTYFGSTITGVFAREANRVCKYRQLLRQTPSKCELALRWWHHDQNYHWFPTVLLSLQPIATKGRAMEQTRAHWLTTKSPHSTTHSSSNMLSRKPQGSNPLLFSGDMPTNSAINDGSPN